MLLNFFKIRDVSSTKLDVVNYCVMRFFLKYLERVKEIELPVFKKGKVLHDLTEHFWTRLGLKYSNSDEFGDYSYGKFMQLVMASEISGRPVDWRNKEEKFTMAENVRKVSKSLFDILLEEGSPLFDDDAGKYFTEVKFDFRAFGRNFTGKIDEIRMKNGGIVIRDYKSGKPWMGNMKLHHDPQMTIYNVALCSMAKKDKRFAELTGLSKDRHKFDGNPLYVNDNIHHEFFMLDAPYVIEKNNETKKIKNLPKVIYETKRKNNHFLEIIKMLDGAESIIRSGKVYAERGRKCDDCNMNIECEKKLDEIGKEPIAEKDGQLMFSYSTPYYTIPLNHKNLYKKQLKLLKEPKKTFKILN